MSACIQKLMVSLLSDHMRQDTKLTNKETDTDDLKKIY